MSEVTEQIESSIKEKQDSIELGEKPHGRIKVYFNSEDKEKAEQIIKNAIDLKKLALEKHKELDNYQ